MVTISQVAVFTTIEAATQAVIQAKLLWQMKAFQSRQFCSTCKVPPDFANHQLRRLYPFAKNGQCDFFRRIFPGYRHQTHYRQPKPSALTNPQSGSVKISRTKRLWGCGNQKQPGNSCRFGKGADSGRTCQTSSPCSFSLSWLTASSNFSRTESGCSANASR